MSDFAIELSALRKAFNGNAALDGLDLRVSRGSIFGFLGKNGAGKTTTMKVLMGLMKTTKSFELTLTALVTHASAQSWDPIVTRAGPGDSRRTRPSTTEPPSRREKRQDHME